MEQMYFDKLTVGEGAAPCVQDGLLSLAICKPMIRIEALSQGHQIYHGEQLRIQLQTLQQQVRNEVRPRVPVKQSSPPRADVSHRSRAAFSMDPRDL
jgi:hypothetical protein